MNDIKTYEDIKKVVDAFYDKVNNDLLIGPIFNEVANVDWKKHLPKMYDFWNTLLFYSGTYKGSPFPKHAVLPLKKEYFERWLFLFEETIKAYFEGEKASEMFNKAKNIGFTFMAKMNLLS